MKRKNTVRLIAFSLCAVTALCAGLIIKHRAATSAENELKLSELRRDALLAEAVDELEKNVNAAAVLSDSDVRAKYCCRAYSACRTAENCLSTTQAGESVYILLDIIKEECLSFGSVGAYSAEISQLKEKLGSCGGDYSSLTVDIAAPVDAKGESSATARVSEEEARKTAAEFMGADPSLLTPRMQTKGAIPCYSFACASASVYVSKESGKVRLYTCETVYAKAELDFDAAVSRAAQFVERCDCGKSEVVSAVEGGGLVTCVFACVHSGVLCLNETVRITVSRENGKATFYDSTQMLLNCRERTVPENTITASQAENALAEGVSAASARLVFINDSENRERLCYELTVHCQSEQSLVYVDAVSGKAVEVKQKAY